MNKLLEFASPLGRLFISFMFVMSGISKITAYQGTQGYMEAMGVPGMLLPLVIFTEVVLGLAVIVGFKTRIAAFGLAGFSILSAILFHANFGDQMQMTMFMKNIAIAGGFLFLVAHGAGSYALDNRKAS
jgi:putative oxidoreductase